MEQLYTATSSEIARRAECAAPTVTEYARLGLVDHVTASNGVRLFKPEAAEAVKAIIKQRLARRGGTRVHAA